MLKTFEMKMKAIGAVRLTREHVGRDRYESWSLPNGIELLVVHSNEHVKMMTLNGFTVAKALSESEEQHFTVKGFEDVMQFLDVTYLPIHQKGEFLAHVLYFQPKDTLFSMYSPEKRLLVNGYASGFGSVISQEIYDDLVSKAILPKLKMGEPLEYDPVALAKWVEKHPQAAFRMDGLVESVNNMIMGINAEATMKALVEDFAKNIGLDCQVEVSSPEELAKELHEMQNSPGNLGSGFAFFNSDGTEMNQDNATVEEFVEAVTGVKVQKPIEPESNLPS